MCGRFTIRTNTADVARQFTLFDPPELTARYNVAPTQDIAAVRLVGGERTLSFLRWGLVPPWAEDLTVGNRMINARGETVLEKRSFSGPLARRRCLIVADGFYEWQKQGSRKQPYHIRLLDECPFGLAGLWERWQRDGRTVESCTIVTTTANEVVQPVHERMPVIVAPDDYQRWLDTETTAAAEAATLLRPFPAQLMTATPVGTWVNSPSHEGPQCVQPA